MFSLSDVINFSYLGLVFSAYSSHLFNGMADIKYTYFDLRVKGEPARLLLAYGGVKYEDERIPCPWDDPEPWASKKGTTPWGQMPLLM